MSYSNGSHTKLAFNVFIFSLVCNVDAILFLLLFHLLSIRISRFIEHYSKWLPPNHFALCDVELTLTQAIGSEGPTSLQLVSDERLQLKIDLCQKLLKLVKILAAGKLDFFLVDG